MNYFTTKQLSKILGYNDDSYIRKLILSGKIKAEKIGRQWMVSEESAYEYKTKNQIQDKFKSLISFNYELRKLIAGELDKEKKLIGPKDGIISFSLGKAFKTQGAILNLCEEGYGEDATVLVRTLFEIMINNLFILKDKSEETAYRYLNYDWVLRKKMFDYAKSKPEIVSNMNERNGKVEADRIIKEIEEQYKSVQEKYKYKGNRWSSQNIADMAEDVGRGDAYKTIYRLQCQFSHTLIRVMNDYAKENVGGGLLFSVGISENWVEQNLVATFDFLSNIYTSFCDHFDLEKEQLKQLVDRYLEYMKTV